MRFGLRRDGAIILSLIVCCAALSTMNASHLHRRAPLSCARPGSALERLRIWNVEGNNPRNAIILQSLIALALVIFGAMAANGFQAMVEYTAPVFWFFLLLVGVSLFVLRHRDPKRPRPFRVPLYPVTPLLFCLICAYLIYSSFVYTGTRRIVRDRGAAGRHSPARLCARKLLRRRMATRE